MYIYKQFKAQKNLIYLTNPAGAITETYVPFFRIPFESIRLMAMHCMNCCILQSLSSFHQRKGECILQYGVWFCYVVRGVKRKCNEKEMSIPRKVQVLYGLFQW
jgi:hypothetical protein